MKRSIRILAAAVVALAACDRAITASEQQLQGTWRADEHDSDTGGGGPKDAYSQLTFGPGGAYVAEYFSYGGYGRAAGVPTAYYRSDGEYRLVGDSLQVRIFRETSTDVQFAGSNFTRTVDGGWAGSGTVEIDGDHLVHRYITCPADAPEPTVATYTRLKD